MLLALDLLRLYNVSGTNNANITVPPPLPKELHIDGKHWERIKTKCHSISSEYKSSSFPNNLRQHVISAGANPLPAAKRNNFT